MNTTEFPVKHEYPIEPFRKIEQSLSLLRNEVSRLAESLTYKEEVEKVEKRHVHAAMVAFFQGAPECLRLMGLDPEEGARDIPVLSLSDFPSVPEQAVIDMPMDVWSDMEAHLQAIRYQALEVSVHLAAFDGLPEMETQNPHAKHALRLLLNNKEHLMTTANLDGHG